MFSNSPRNNASTETESSDSFQALSIYNALLRVFGFAQLAMTAQNEEIALEACQNFSENLAEEIGGDDAADKAEKILSNLTEAESLDEFTSSEEKIVVDYLRTHFEITKNIHDEELQASIASQPKQVQDADTNTETDRTYKRKIKTTHDAVLAMYQLIDEILPDNVDMADTLMRAADIFDKKIQQPTVFKSTVISEQQIEDDKLFNIYNTLMLTLVNNATLSNTASNVEFAKMALTQARNTTLLQSKADQKQQLAYPVAESKENQEEDAESYPEVAFYNALRRHFNYAPLTSTEANNALAQNLLAAITTELSSLFDKDKATDILVDLINNQERDSQATAAEKQQALDHLQTYFENAEIEVINEELQFIITQPELILEKSRNNQLTDIEKKYTKKLTETLREITTPINQYNQLLKLFFDNPYLPPLSDTESNSVFATDALQAIINGVTKDLAGNIPPVTTAAEIIAILNKNQSSKKALLIDNSLQKHLAKTMHESLLRYNVAQRYFLFEPLENTVENNQFAQTAIESFKQQIGAEKAEEILTAMKNNPQELEAKHASDETREAVNILNEYYVQANVAAVTDRNRPTIYTRLIIKMLENNKDVTRHEKIQLLRMLSSMILKRQQSITEKLSQDNANRVSEREFDSNEFATAGTMTTDLDMLLASHNAAMTDYFRITADNSVAELGISIIKQLYALQLGAEEAELKIDNATPSEPVVEEEKMDAVTDTTHPKTPTTPEPEDKAEQTGGNYQPQPKPESLTTTSTSTSESDDETDTEEARQEVSSSSKREGEFISLADEIRQAIEANRKTSEIARQKENAAKQQREALALEQERKEEEQQKISDEQEYLSFAVQLQNIDALPAGYLSKPRNIISLMDDMEEEETKTPDTAISIVTSTIPEEKTAETQEVVFTRRLHDTTPNVAIISNAQAMWERTHEYAMIFIPPQNERTKAAVHIEARIVAAFKEKIRVLMDLIQVSCAAADVQVMTHSNTELTQIFLLSNQRNVKISFDHLYVLQASIVKEATAHIKLSQNEQIKKIISDLNNATIEKKLINTIGASCLHIIKHGETNEKALATTLLKKSTAFLDTKIFNKNQYLSSITSALVLADLCRQPTPAEKSAQTTVKVAQDFITVLTFIYAWKNKASEQHQLALAQLASSVSPKEIQLARTAIASAEMNLQNVDIEAEDILKNEFKQFFSTITELSNINKNEKMTLTEIAANTDAFSQKFFRKINSSRLQTMRHIAMITLENLEQLHKAAAAEIHPSKALFDEYWAKIWGISLELSDATENEIKLKQLLDEFLEKTAHQIDIQVGGKDLIHFEPSTAEDQRQRLLIFASNYLHSLKVLKGTLAVQYVASIVTIIAELKTRMREILALNFKHDADQQKIVQLRSEIEYTAAGWDITINQIIQANKLAQAQPVAVRAPGHLSMFEEARRIAADRLKTLASIFKPIGLKL
jgi:hypothetical protein